MIAPAGVRLLISGNTVLSGAIALVSWRKSSTARSFARNRVVRNPTLMTATIERAIASEAIHHFGSCGENHGSGKRYRKSAIRSRRDDPPANDSGDSA